MPDGHIPVSSPESLEFIVDNRRHLVSALRLRRYSIQEIVSELERQDCINPDTGKPWTPYVVQSDIRFLEARWREHVTANVIELKAGILAELREVRRAAWRRRALDIVLRSIKQECDLMGLNEPTRVDIEEYVRSEARARNLDPDAAVRETVRILEQHQRQGGSHH